MFPSSAVSSGLTLTKVAGGISKTLGIVNQAIPIYKEVKPIAQKARGMYSLVKEFGSIPNNKTNNTTNINNTNINNNLLPNRFNTNQTLNTQEKRNVSTTSPVFFQ